MHAERCYCGTVHGSDQTNAIPIRGQPNVQLVRVGDDLLHEYLLVVLFAERTEIVPGRIAKRRINGFQ